MPLPTNGPLSLLAYSRPGETAHSKPKQAMIVRMSEETLDALQSFPNQPQVDIVFGDRPVLYIGDQSFPMIPAHEGTPHEIYLRAAPAAKKNGPLKLYANVVGKFTVERELGERVADKVRVSTIDAANQRNGRTTIMLDTPPTLPSQPSRKRKDPPTMFRNPARPSDQSKVNAASSSSAPAPARFASPAPRNTEGLVPLRQRIIHCLAGGEKTAEELVRIVGGANCSSLTQSQIRDVMAEVAELSTTKTKDGKPAKTYQLKPKSWLETRPFEWPRLSDTDRKLMARNARMKLNGLGIPEDDPIWTHFRNTKLENAGKPEPAKRGISSKDLKEKKSKSKFDPREIKMKNESLRAAPKPNHANGKPKESDFRNDSPISSSKLVAADKRKAPASDLKVKGPSHESLADSGSRAPASNLNEYRRDRESMSSSHPSKPQPSSSSVNQDRNPAPSISAQKRTVVDERHGPLESDRERRRDREWERTKQKEKARASEREEGERSDDSSEHLRRKRHMRDQDDYETISKAAPQKKRKTDMDYVPSSSSKSTNAHNLNYSKKPELGSLTKPKPVKKEPSPLPPPLPKIRKDVTSSSRPPAASAMSPASVSSPSTPVYAGNNRSSKGAKARRRSPKFTSSEDEGDTAPPRSNNRRETGSEVPRLSHKLPKGISRTKKADSSDHASLRNEYGETHERYLHLYSTIYSQRRKIENMLQKRKAGSVTDSDEDAELLDEEEMSRLETDYMKLHAKLSGIEQALKGSSKVGSSSE